MLRPVCVRCIHYFVTYEPSRPHGCRAMGFKSRQNPAVVVFRNSGVSCQMFREKRPDDEKNPGSSRGGIVA